MSCGADLGRMNLGRGGGGVDVAMVLKYTSLFHHHNHLMVVEVVAMVL